MNSCADDNTLISEENKNTELITFFQDKSIMKYIIKKGKWWYQRFWGIIMYKVLFRLSCMSYTTGTNYPSTSRSSYQSSNNPSIFIQLPIINECLLCKFMLFTQTHINTYIYTHTNTQTHTHVHTHIHIRTHTQTHIYNIIIITILS